MYIPNFFSIEELVPPSVYSTRRQKAWQLLDERMLITIDQLREVFGPMFINTWHSEKLSKAYGVRKHSGLRTVEFFNEVYGNAQGYTRYLASYSQHKYGRAFDALFRDHSAEEVREAVRQNPRRFPYLTAMERNISWFHGDVRNVPALMEFDP